jgi:two-component system, NtrC family, sensor kinase
MKELKTIKDYRILNHKILDFARQSISRIEFIREVSGLIIEFSKSDALDLFLKVDRHFFQYSSRTSDNGSLIFNIIPFKNKGNGREKIKTDNKSCNFFEKLWNKVYLDYKDDPLANFTSDGSFWVDDSSLLKKKENTILNTEDYLSYKSIAKIPLIITDEKIGFLQLKSNQLAYFTKEEIINYEDIAFMLGIIFVFQGMESKLSERVKELTCLYGIAKIAERSHKSLDNILWDIVELLPSAWKYPEISHSKITIHNRVYSSSEFQETWQKQTADIIYKGKKRGAVEIAYSEIKQDIDEGPFLKEERNLIDAIARQIALIIERREADEDKLKLNEQLRHTDRLATIGQLAAGVAHELNEPLGNILGFAQLAKKTDNLAEQTSSDIDKIINATLHAREVIRKLMTFARQTPPKIKKVDLNNLITESLYIIDSMCLKKGIQLVRNLTPDLQKITADPTQLNQVLINLVVNAIQAMPDGGLLTISTITSNEVVCLIVEDTGVGISDKNLKKIFIPFFTTKDKHIGTGLGLSVVHGIVSSHGGTIDVKSLDGKGTRFEINLPLKGPYDLEENS